MRRAALFALASFFLAVVAFVAGNAFSFLVFVILAAGNLLLFAVCGIRCRQYLLIFGFVILAAGNALLISGFVAFGTGEGLLWYGICVPCSKRLPGVHDASSEAFGVKNRLLRYGRDIRCQKQAPVVRDASSKARRTAYSTDCGQPPAAPDASSVRETAPLGGEQTQRGGRPFWSTSSRKVILIYRRHGRHTVNFVSSFFEKREMLTLTFSLSEER